MKKSCPFIIALLFMMLANSVFAQSGTVRLGDGTLISVKTVVTPKGTENALGNIYAATSGDTVHRILTDHTNRLYAGYDLKLRRDVQNSSYTVTILPLSKTPFDILNKSVLSQYQSVAIPSYPNEISISENEMLTVDLLRNEKTGVKISDQIRISFRPASDTALATTSTDTKARSFSFDDVWMKINKPVIEYAGVQYQTNGSIAGGYTWIYIKDVGRLVFSFRKESEEFGFEQVGTINGNEMKFEIEGKQFLIASKESILGSNGVWNLWVRLDSGYAPSEEPSDTDPFIFGATSNLSNLRLN